MKILRVSSSVELPGGHAWLVYRADDPGRERDLVHGRGARRSHPVLQPVQPHVLQTGPRRLACGRGLPSSHHVSGLWVRV